VDKKPFLNSFQKFLSFKGRIKLFITFLAISFVIWFFKKFSKEYQEEIKMKIEIVDVPKSLKITSISDKSLSLNLKATGFHFLYYFFFDNKIKISFKKVFFDNNLGILEIASEFNRLQDQLVGETEILSFFPSKIKITYQSEFSKKVPVNPPKFNLGVGYYITKLNMDPDSIIVTGTKKNLSGINVVNLNFKSELPIKSNFREKISIDNKKNLSYDFNDVNVELTVQLFSEKKIKVPISVINYPSNKVLKLFPSQVELFFSSSISNFKKIRDSDFLIGFDYESVRKEKKTAKLKLIKSPSDARNIRFDPQNVFVLIRE
tara:strand:+ start:3259 stop:4212 length:954 start_codon:yes stop_codon:yes gene_type:complete